MPLNDNALVTINQARLHVLRNDSIATQDDKLTMYINLASDIIQDWCDREFTPTDAITRKFDYDGDGWLPLSPYEIRTVTLLTFYGDTATPQTFTATDYRLEPRNANRWGTYTGVNLLWPSIRGQFGTEVEITANWGMAAVPGAAQIACLVYVEDLFRNPGGFSTMTAGAYTVTEDLSGGYPAGGLPPRAQKLLEIFRREQQLGTINLARPYDSGVLSLLPRP